MEYVPNDLAKKQGGLSMKRIHILAIAIVLVIITSVPAYAGVGDFENANWGMTREQVIAAHLGKSFTEEDDAIWFGNTDTFSSDVTVFSFDEYGRFNTGSYILHDTVDKSDTYLAYYNNIKELAAQKFGSPILDNEEWSDETLKDFPSAYGAAVSSGALTYKTYFQKDTMVVAMQLSSQNYGPKFVMMYIGNSPK